MVIMASDIACGRVRTTAATTTESRNMAAIDAAIRQIMVDRDGSLGLPCNSLILDIHAMIN